VAIIVNKEPSNWKDGYEEVTKEFAEYKAKVEASGTQPSNDKDIVAELEEYKKAFDFLRDKLRVEVSVHPLDTVDIEFILILLQKLTFEGKDVQQVFQTTIKLQEEFKVLKALQEEKKFEQ